MIIFAVNFLCLNAKVMAFKNIVKFKNLSMEWDVREMNFQKCGSFLEMAAMICTHCGSMLQSDKFKDWMKFTLRNFILKFSLQRMRQRMRQKIFPVSCLMAYHPGAGLMAVLGSTAFRRSQTASKPTFSQRLRFEPVVVALENFHDV